MRDKKMYVWRITEEIEGHLMLIAYCLVTESLDTSLAAYLPREHYSESSRVSDAKQQRTPWAEYTADLCAHFRTYNLRAVDTAPPSNRE